MKFHNQAEFDKVYGRTRDESPSCSISFSASSLLKVLPCINVIRNYKKTQVVGDLIAGFTVAAFNIPQGVAYASLANLPPVYGLYMGCLAPFFYFFFGTSHHISVATFAPVCMMVGFSVESISLSHFAISTSNQSHANSFINQSESFDEKHEGGIIIASSISLFSGLFLLLLGTLQLGFVGSYFSGSLVGGFTFGVAFHVATSQLIKVLGISIAKYVDIGCLLFYWRDIALAIGDTNICSLVFGICSGVVLYVVLFLNDKYKSKLKMPIPIELLIVIGAILVSRFAHLQQRYNLQVIGEVPTGFPLPSIDGAKFVFQSSSNLKVIVENSIPIALVSFSITFALAKMLAQQHNYVVDNNQEMVALGFVDLLVSVFGCPPVAASPSRSNLQSQVGGNTQFASILASCILLMVILFAGPLVYYLPYSVLGAIILVALRSFFKQVFTLPDLWRRDRYDFFCWVSTAFLTIVTNLTYGLLLGIVLSLLTVLWRSQKPKFIQMGQINSTNKYRDVNFYKDVKKIPKTLIFRFNMSLYYVNADLFLSSVKSSIESRKLECSSSTEETTLSWLVLDTDSFNFVDHAGAQILHLLLNHCLTENIQLLLSISQREVLEKLEREKFVDKLGLDKVFPSIHDAVLYVNDQLRLGLKEKYNGNVELYLNKLINTDNDNDTSVDNIDNNNTEGVDLTLSSVGQNVGAIRSTSYSVVDDCNETNS